jgi:hypothetical protein
LAGAPAHRASAAFDGDLATSWVTPFEEVVGQSLTLTLPQPRSLDHLDLAFVSDREPSTPRRLVLRNEAGEERVLEIPRVKPDATGIATVPIDFDLLDGTRFTAEVASLRPTVTHEWYCECDQVMPVAIAELGIPDLEPITITSIASV